MSRKKSAVAEASTSESADQSDEQFASRDAQDGESYQQESPAKNYAEAVGKREYQPVPDPFNINTDVVAGMRLSESRRYQKMLISFEEKPSQEVTAALKEGGFRWEPMEKVWAKDIRDNPLSARIKADEVFKEVSKMIRAERGIEHSVGIGS